MKTAITTFLLAQAVSAFPALQDGAFAKRQSTTSPQGTGWLPAKPPPFDAASQYVSTTGTHAFVAPGPNDIRGECPGLNALANHGYLPHNGVATIQQYIDATYDGVGMEKDLGGFLAIFGAVIDGNGLSWNLLGAPHTGIGGSHHNYEADSSPTRPDLNQYGNNYKVIKSQFLSLYNLQPNAATANYNLDVLTQHRGLRFQQSVSQNPYFYYGPFDGIEVSQAAFTFIYRFMSNKSATYPEGVLNKQVLKSWFSIQGPENNLAWVPGNERIPDNWYKRNAADTYSIPYFEADIIRMAATLPQILTIGCNKGKVNTYTTYTPEALTGGAVTAAQVAKSPFCYGAGFVEAAGPTLLGITAAQSAQLNAALAPYTKNCPAFAVNQTALNQLKACPGFSNYGGPTGPVAPGAIQS